MRVRKYAAQRRGERGQTIALIAISIVSLLAMAALAIDVVSLYTAKSEIQRAADAAALAGAKAIADSGVTTLSLSDSNITTAETLATGMANAAINAVLANNLVAGTAPICSNCPLGSGAGIDYTRQGNPIVTVTLQRASLPTFFARVLGQRGATTGATAVAEVYNPSNPPSANSYAYTPILTRCVKPWLVGNQDPVTNNAFVTPSTGAVENIVGEMFSLQSGCSGGNLLVNCVAPVPDPPGRVGSVGSGVVSYLPAKVVATSGDVCPSLTASPCGGGNNATYKSGVECCNTTAYSCGGNTFTNMGADTASWDQTVNPAFQGVTSDVAEGTECLIHASAAGSGNGQDTLAWTNAFPNGPPQITAGSASPMNGSLVSTSSSVVTIPIIDRTSGAFDDTFPFSVTVVGFLQAFVNYIDSTQVPNINITVLNVVGCSQTPNGSNPVVGGVGSSPIPVRLITPP